MFVLLAGWVQRGSREQTKAFKKKTGSTNQDVKAGVYLISSIFVLAISLPFLSYTQSF